MTLKLLELTFEFRESSGDLDPVSEPERYFLLVLRVLESFISHNDDAEIILVADDSSYSLINCP